MYDRLRQLRESIPRPKLGATNGMRVAVYADGQVVQFPDDESAEFFVRAYDNVLALIGEAESERALRVSPENARLKQRVAELEAALVAAHKRVSALEHACARAADGMATAAARARAATRVASHTVALQEQVTELQRCLEQERSEAKNGGCT